MQTASLYRELCSFSVDGRLATRMLLAGQCPTTSSGATTMTSTVRKKSVNIRVYSRTPIIRINWDQTLSGSLAIRTTRVRIIGSSKYTKYASSSRNWFGFVDVLILKKWQQFPKQREFGFWLIINDETNTKILGLFGFTSPSETWDLSLVIKKGTQYILYNEVKAHDSPHSLLFQILNKSIPTE